MPPLHALSHPSDAGPTVRDHKSSFHDSFQTASKPWLLQGVVHDGLPSVDLRLKDETKRAEESFDAATPRSIGTRARRTFVATEDSDHTNIRDASGSGSDIDHLTTSQLQALVTTANKRLNRPTETSKMSRLSTNARDGTQCLVLGCKEMCSMPICRLHFATIVCGKESALVLRNSYGKITYNRGQ